MQDFESELVPTERHIPQVVKGPSVGNDSGSKVEPCLNLELGKEAGEDPHSETEPTQQKPSFEETLISKIQKKLQEPLPQEEEKPTPLFMSKTDWEAQVAGEAEVPTPSTAEIEGVVVEAPPTIQPPSCHYDTLLRFAALELEAVIK
jgi:hypothetical protein